MHNVVFGKTMENVRKHRDIKVVTTERRRNNLVSETNFHTTNLCFILHTRKLISNRNENN